MSNRPLSCRVLALGTRGDFMLPQSLAGLEVVWTTSTAANGALYDLYVLDTAAGTREVLSVYLRIRQRERNVAVILLATQRNVPVIERKVDGDPLAYVTARDSHTRLRQLVDQVIESTRARAMDARIEETRTVMEGLNARGLALEERSRNWQRRLTSRQWLGLRAESLALFHRSGGTLAQFDQLWAGVCHEALEQAHPARAPE